MTISSELSLIIPTYNERENLPTLVEGIVQALSGYSYELIVVDDDSPDGTAELAQSLAAKYPIRVIRRRNVRGLATAVVEGFRYARGKVLGVMDADLQHPPKLVPELLREIRMGVDIAIATRYAEGGGIKNWSWGRRIISKGAMGLAHLLLPSTRKVSDPLSGFFLLKREVIDGVELQPTGYKILLEVLVRGKANKIAAVPYIFTERIKGSSKFNLKEQINFLHHLLCLRQISRRQKRLNTTQ